MIYKKLNFIIILILEHQWRFKVIFLIRRHNELVVIWETWDLLLNNKMNFNHSLECEERKERFKNIEI